MARGLGLEVSPFADKTGHTILTTANSTYLYFIGCESYHSTNISSFKAIKKIYI